MNNYTGDAYDYAHWQVCYPAAYYYNNRTYVTYQGDDQDFAPYILYYDHDTNVWSPRYKIADSPLGPPNDNHGPPCLWINDTGYIHVLFGAHGTPFKHSRSTNPEDISSWTVMDDIGATVTYPHVSYDSTNDVVHLYYRWDDAPDGGDLRYVNSTNNGITWSTEQNLVDYVSGRWPYPYGAGGIDPYNNELLHIGWSGYRYSPGLRFNIYYVALNVTTGGLYNASGDYLGTTITESVANASCLVYEKDDNDVWGPDVHVDSSSTPYVMFTYENTTSSGYGTTVFAWWNGTAWESQEVTTPAGYSAPHDFIVHSPTSITAFLNDNDDDGKNIVRWTWDGTSWTAAETIFDNGQRTGMTCVPAPYNGGQHGELQVIWTDWGKDGSNSMAWAWGPEGIVQWANVTGAIFWVRIPYDLSTDGEIIYIYYGNAEASTQSDGADTFILFDDFNRADSDTVGNSWTEDENSGNLTVTDHMLEIEQYTDYYCHLEQSTTTYPNLVLRGKLRVTSGGPSWTPSITLYWGAYDWIEIGYRSNTDQFYAEQDIDSTVGGTSSGSGSTGQWYYYAVVVSSSTIYANYSSDGLTWSSVTSFSRPAGWTGHQKIATIKVPAAIPPISHSRKLSVSM